MATAKISSTRNTTIGLLSIEFRSTELGSAIEDSLAGAKCLWILRRRFRTDKRRLPLATSTYVTDSGTPEFGNRPPASRFLRRLPAHRPRSRSRCYGICDGVSQFLGGESEYQVACSRTLSPQTSRAGGALSAPLRAIFRVCAPPIWNAIPTPSAPPCTPYNAAQDSDCARPPVPHIAGPQVWLKRRYVAPIPNLEPYCSRRRSWHQRSPKFPTQRRVKILINHNYLSGKRLRMTNLQTDEFAFLLTACLTEIVHASKIIWCRFYQ